MGTNTGPGAKHIVGAKIRDRTAMMRTFDNFPRAVRVALANSDNDWSVEQVYWALRGGHKGMKVPALTPDAVIALIQNNDTRLRKRA
jgi:hypothetical protein